MRLHRRSCVLTLIVILVVSAFGSIGWAHRLIPPDITGHLTFRSPPRLGQSSTLVFSAKSHLSDPVQAVVRLRLPRRVATQSVPEQALYLPALSEASQSFAIQFDAPGTYPVQVSVYAGNVIRHFVVYVRLGNGQTRVSTRPLPGEEPQALATQARMIKRAPVGSVEIRGRITYYDDNLLALQPIQHMKVELWEANAGKDVLLAHTESDRDGIYAFPAVQNEDPEDVSRRDLYIAAVFENEASRITDSNEDVYTLESELLENVSDGQFDVDLALDETHNRRGAGHIFNVMGDAHDFLTDETGWSRTVIPVIWPTNEGGSFYAYYTQGGDFSDEIHIVNTHAWERITMLHEYGHSVMSAAYENDFDRIPTGEYDQPHFVDTVSDPGFALSEGWAEFMEAAVDDNATHLRGYSNRDTPNVEDNAWYTGAVDGTGSNTDGNIVEGAVASILWDIKDTAQSVDLTPGIDDDDATDLFRYAWQVFTEDFPQDIRTVGVRWQERNLPQSDTIETIFATHGILLRTNRPPDLNVTSPAQDHLSTGQFSIAWQVDDLDGDPVTADLFFDRDTSSGGTFSIERDVEASIGQYLWNTEGLPQGAYYVLIRVIDSRGASAEAYSDGRVIVDPTPLPAPTVVSETHPDPSQWVANPSPSLIIESEATQFSYILNQSTDTDPDTSPDVTSRDVDFQQLGDGVWWFHVRAYDSLGYWSDTTHYAIRIHTQAPPTPPNLGWYVDAVQAGATTESSDLQLRWDTVLDISGIDRYEIQIRPEADEPVDASVSADASTFSFAASSGVRYEARVRAVNSAGLQSHWSPTAVVSVLEPRPWDVNGDTVVDILDLTIVALSFGSAVSGTPDENPDVTRDGLVDILDLVAVGQHFGESYGLAAPRLAATRAGLFLLPNYPNPFNPETWIPFVVLRDGEPQVTIYSAQGEVLRQWSLGHRSAGAYVTRSDAVYWDGRNALGESVSSGPYFCQVQVAGEIALRKLVVLR